MLSKHASAFIFRNVLNAEDGAAMDARKVLVVFFSRLFQMLGLYPPLNEKGQSG